MSIVSYITFREPAMREHLTENLVKFASLHLLLVSGVGVLSFVLHRRSLTIVCAVSGCSGLLACGMFYKAKTLRVVAIFFVITALGAVTSLACRILKLKKGEWLFQPLLVSSLTFFVIGRFVHRQLRSLKEIENVKRILK